MFHKDGVKIFNKNILDKKAIENLKKIVDGSGAAIVLSSSWRYSENGVKDLTRQLNEFSLFISSVTPKTHAQCQRGDEISRWFDEHPGVNVESYVILDDDRDMTVHMDHLVKTDFWGWGLTDRHVRDALRILNGGDSDG